MIFRGEKQGALKGRAVNEGSLFFPNEIRKSSIWIAPFITSLDRRRIIRHEFMHAIGLGHSKVTNLILSESTEYSIEEYEEFDKVYKRIDGLDKALVTLLYDQCIPLGLTEVEFADQLKKLNQDSK